MNMQVIQEFGDKGSALAKHSRTLTAFSTVVEQSMAGGRTTSHPDCATLFLAGQTLSEIDRQSLGYFAADRGWAVVHLGFSAEELRVEPKAIGEVSCFVPLKPGQALPLVGGKFWQAGRGSKLAIAFPDLLAKLSLSNRGNLIVREPKRPFHEEGFESARRLIARCSAAARPSAGMFGTFYATPVVMNLANFAKGQASL